MGEAGYVQLPTEQQAESLAKASNERTGHSCTIEWKWGRPGDPAFLDSRRRQDRTAGRTFFVLTLVPVVLMVLITVALALRFLPILKEYSLWELVSGTVWKPEKASSASGPSSWAPFG